jgi:hypothetical protein
MRRHVSSEPYDQKDGPVEKLTASLLLRRSVVRRLAERDVCPGSDRRLGAVAAV